MPISIDWGTKVISLARSDLLLLQSTPTEIRQLNLDTFRLELKDIEDSVLGMTHLNTHNHNTSVSVGGVVLARVVEIINGYTVTFEDGQYAVNLVGANSNVGDVVNVNQVSVRSANSAGLQDLSTILSAAYQGVVWVDTVLGQAGRDVPLGTRSRPVNNMVDAVIIAQREGANTIKLSRSLTLTTETIPPGYIISSDSPNLVTVTIDPAATVEGCEFSNIGVSGRVDGDNIIKNCVVYNIDFASGFFFNSELKGRIDVIAGAECGMYHCSSGIAGGDTGQHVDVYMGGSNGSLIIRDFHGGLGIHEFTGGTGSVSIDMSSGRVILASDVTDGIIHVRGIADVVDNTTGTTTVVNRTLNRDLDTINAGVQKASLLIPHNLDLE